MNCTKNKRVFRSYVNSFHYLYQDAEFMHDLVRKGKSAIGFNSTRLCRTALLLYILSCEALINRAMAEFLPDQQRDFFMEREDRLSIEDKWQLLPMLKSEERESFDISRYPWTHFKELVRVRNDFVHPKSKRAAYYREKSSKNWEPLPWKQIPNDLNIKETDVIYRQTQIPRDPYAIRLNHVDTTKKIIDDLITKLDTLLCGVISENNWLRSDQMELIYPEGANISDMGPTSKEHG